MKAPATFIASGMKNGRLLTALSLIVPLILFVAAARYDESAERGRATETVAVTAAALSEHAQAVFDSLDLVMARVVDHLDQQSWDEIRASQSLHDFLVGIAGSLPQVESIFLVDPRGFIAASSRNFPTPPFDAREREYFVRAKAESTLVVSAPFRGATAGTYAFTLSRAIVKNGDFGGIVAVTVYPGYFESFYRTTLYKQGSSTTALIRAEDGTVLVHYPGGDAPPPKLPSRSALMREAAAQTPSGTYTSKSSLDGVDRLTGFARLPRYPLIATYSLDEALVMHAVYVHRVMFAVFATTIGIALFLTARLTLAHATRERDTLQRLLQETEKRRDVEAKLQQTQKMEALGRLTGGVAHDFNNLLTAVLGGLELAIKRVSDPAVLRLLTMAQEAARRGAKLTAQMLAFARKQDVVLESVDTVRVLRETNDLLVRTLGGLIEVDYDLAAETWPVLADAVQLQVAILNLAVNARDAMPLGGRLVVSTRMCQAPAPGLPEALRPGDYVAVAVRDTGTGMSEEVKAKAFEPFFTTKGPTHGTGLGLSMVLGFASQTGGTVSIDSAPNQGTTVTLFLPRATVAAKLAAAPGEPAAAALGLRILLVDDDARVRGTARDMLQDAGHRVVVAEGAAEALACLQGDAFFDLVITDYAMPGVDGCTLAAETERLRPNLPVLLMTGYAEDEALSAWTARGRRVMAKPFTADHINQMAAAVAGEVAGRNVIPFRGR